MVSGELKPWFSHIGPTWDKYLREPSFHTYLLKRDASSARGSFLSWSQPPSLIEGSMVIRGGQQGRFVFETNQDALINNA